MTCDASNGLTNGTTGEIGNRDGGGICCCKSLYDDASEAADMSMSVLYSSDILVGSDTTSNGRGCGVADVDCDGWPDLAAATLDGHVMRADSSPNRLCRNVAGSFVDVSENANYLVGNEMILSHDVTEMLPSRTEVPGLNNVTSN